MSAAEKTAKPTSKLETNSFDWADPLLIDHDLTAEERMVRDSARDYCQDKLASRVKLGFRNETFDRAIMTEMGAIGLLGLTLPETYGCAGLSYVCYGLVAREVERVDSGYRSAMSVQILARDASDLRLWQRGAAEEISARAGAAANLSAVSA